MPLSLSLHSAAARPSAWAPFNSTPSRAAQLSTSLQRHRLSSQQQPGSPSPWQRSRSSLAAPAAASAGGSSPAQPSSGPHSELCPLHVCLLRYGITDLAAFSKPHHLALSQEAVDADVEPKLVALRAEGLSPVQLQKLMPAKGSSFLPCSYQDTFVPNLELLRSIAAPRKPSKRKGQQQLTVVGWLLARNRKAAVYLARSPAAVQRLLAWLEGSLGIGLAELAECSQLLEALRMSEAACKAAASLLLGKGVPAARVAQAFKAKPSMFNHGPEVIDAKLGYLASTLQVDAATALDLVLQQSQVLTVNLEGRLPQLLEYLDEYMGEEGAGRRLVLKAPVLCSITAATAQRGVSNLATLGYSQQQVQGFINKHPVVLWCDLGSPDQRQKLEWVNTVSPWTLDDFLASPTYFFSASTLRLASRLAWMRAAGLEPPRTPGMLAATSDATFMSSMGRKLQRRLAREGDSSEQLPVLGVGDWKLWEADWLQSEEGQRWGFLPEK